MKFSSALGMLLAEVHCSVFAADCCTLPHRDPQGSDQISSEMSDYPQRRTNIGSDVVSQVRSVGGWCTKHHVAVAGGNASTLTTDDLPTMTSD